MRRIQARNRRFRPVVFSLLRMKFVSKLPILSKSQVKISFERWNLRVQYLACELIFSRLLSVGEFNIFWLAFKCDTASYLSWGVGRYDFWLAFQVQCCFIFESMFHPFKFYLLTNIEFYITLSVSFLSCFLFFVVVLDYWWY